MGEIVCKNCRRGIPETNYQMHAMHCARNIALCPQCDEPIPRHELEQHMKEECEMRKIECDRGCGTTLAISKLENHKEQECPKRTTLCKFCATLVEVGTLGEHEDYCGSRTEKCEVCGEYIMLKNFDSHNKNDCKPKNQVTATSYTSARRSSTVSSIYSSSRWTAGLYGSSSSSTVNEPAETPSSYSRPSILSAANNSSSASVSSYSRTSASNSSYASSKTNASSDAAAYSASTSSSTTNNQSNDDEVVMIPCENCDKLISATKLLSHQASCMTFGTRSSSIQRSTSSARVDTSYNRASSTDTRSSPEDTSKKSYSSSIVGRYLDTGSSIQKSTSSSYLRRDASSSRIGSRFLSDNDNTQSSSSSLQKSTSSSILKRDSSTTRVGSRFSNESESSQKSSYSRTERSSQRKQSVSFDVGGDDKYKTSSTSSSQSQVEKFKTSSSTTGSSQEDKFKTSYQYQEEAKKAYSSSETPGMYENDQDRERLRTMLSSLRRDPMEVENDPDNNDGSFFPCEFCGDPYPCEYLMRHQISCDLNPQPISSGSGFDYNAIRRNLDDNIGVANIRDTREQERRLQHSSTMPVGNTNSVNAGNEESNGRSRISGRLSRSNSVVEQSYSYRRSSRASSVSRTSSFADRNYGTRSNLARQSSFTLQDYSNATRRSSIYEGISGYSIYTSIGEGLDQITYGNRTSRRNSISDNTVSANYSLSRQSSFSTRNSVPISALMASIEANKVQREDTSSQANSHNGYGHQNGYSQQNNYGYQNGFGQNNNHEERKSVSMQEQQSNNNHSYQPAPLQRQESEAKVGKKDKKDKPKRTKEEKEQRKIEKEQRRQRKAEKAARKMSIQAAADNSTGALLEQVSQKLAANDAAISAVQAPEAPKAPERRRESLLEKSAANVTNSTNVAQTSTANAIQTQKRAESVTRSTIRSDENKLSDRKSAANLAKDLAAECAKAYELMESSLSRLSNDFAVGSLRRHASKTKINLLQ